MKKQLKIEKIKTKNRNVYFKKYYDKIIDKIDLSKYRILQIEEKPFTVVVKYKSYIIKMTFLVNFYSYNGKITYELACNVYYLILNNKLKKKSDKRILNILIGVNEFIILYHDEFGFIKHFLNNENNSLIKDHLIENFSKISLKRSIYNFLNKNDQLKIDLKVE